MIGDLKPYPTYQRSSLPWLDAIPVHWESRRLRHATDMRVSNVDKHTKSGETPVRLCNYVEVYKHERIRETTRFMPATATEDERNRFQLHRGDVLITKDSEQWNDIGVPALVEHDAPDLVCGYHVAILRPRPALSGPFLLRALQCHLIAAQFHVEANGVTRYGLSHGAIQGVAIPLPPPAEQAAIVRFLDWANGRLERAIRAKRKVIALLGEQKQAIIHRAVTRGLDPTVPLKPSGIPWLGEIPAHWEVRQLRHLGRLYKGMGGSKEDATIDGVPCIRYGELYFHYRNFIRQPRGFVSESTAASYSTICFGDVLFAASGERVEEIGKSAVNLYTRPAVCGGDIVIFRPSIAVCPAFLGYSLDSYGAAHQKATMCRGTTIKHIYPDELRGLWTCIPPMSEQEAIASELDRALSGSNAAISRLEREITLLREYRTRLVADVVTGKLDVREVAARLPDEAPLDNAQDDTDLTDESDPTAEEAEE